MKSKGVPLKDWILVGGIRLSYKGFNTLLKTETSLPIFLNIN
jgi:hypothetical protein